MSRRDDDDTRRIFTGCLNRQLEVLDAADGRVVATLPIGLDGDSVAIDAKRRLVFSANSRGTLSVVAIRGDEKFEVRTLLRTPLGARAMAVDSATGRIFLASATASGQMEAAAPGGTPRSGSHQAVSGC